MLTFFFNKCQNPPLCVFVCVSTCVRPLFLFFLFSHRRDSFQPDWLTLSCGTFGFLEAAHADSASPCTLAPSPRLYSLSLSDHGGCSVFQDLVLFFCFPVDGHMTWDVVKRDSRQTETLWKINLWSFFFLLFFFPPQHGRTGLYTYPRTGLHAARRHIYMLVCTHMVAFILSPKSASCGTACLACDRSGGGGRRDKQDVERCLDTYCTNENF